MSFKIPCGGFKLDEESFSLDENGVLSVSGGSGGGSDFVTVTFTVDENGAFVADKSYEEIHDAYNAGKDIRGMIMYAPDDVEVLTLSAVSYSEVSFFIVSVSANDGSGGIIELYYPKFGVIRAFMTPLTFTELNPTTEQ